MPHIPGVADHAAAPARPEPVLDAAKLGGLLSALFIAAGGVAGIFVAGFTVDDLGALGFALAAVIVAAAAVASYAVQVWQGYKARALVTPLSSPRNADGVPLMEVPGLSPGPRG